jgi:ferredoxin
MSAGQGKGISPGPEKRPGAGPGKGSSTGREAGPGPSLRVNPIACEAHGLCIEMLPELIRRDPWGFPIVTPGPVPGGLLPLARRAAALCPTLALLLTQEEQAPGAAGSEDGADRGR